MNNDNQKPVRICFVMPKAYPLFNQAIKTVFGGAEVDLYMLATELAKDAGFEVSFITADYGQAAVETIADVKIIKSLDFKKSSLRGAWDIWHAMKKVDADIYMLKTASPGVALAAVFCQTHKSIFTYRTAAAAECDGTYRRNHPLTGSAFNWSLRRAGAVFAQNADDRDNLKKTIGVNAVVIPNGHIMVPLKLTAGYSILWVGRSDRVKRPDLFLEMAKAMPKEKFTMICQQATGDNGYEKLKSQAAGINNVEFIERVPLAEIDKYFSAAKIFVNTSNAEGFPNTFIQACKNGTAIVSLSVNPDGFLDKYNCGQSCGGDLGKLIESLGHILENERYIELGKNGRKYVEQKHDIKKIVEEYKNIFRTLVEKRRQGVCAE